MRRVVVALVLGWLIALTVLASPVPVMADHIGEPTIAIRTVTLNVFKYPDGGTILTACDGSEVRTWDTARIEMKLGFEQPYKGSNEDPSEHFETLLTVTQVQNGPGGAVKKRDWDSNWSHQNRPPHSSPLAQRWEAGPANTYQLQDHVGLWEISVRVTGAESARVLEDVCRFQIVAP